MSAYEDFDPDNYDDGDEYSARCTHCRKAGLQWLHTGERWRLFDENNKPHACKPVVRDDDFEDVS